MSPNSLTFEAMLYDHSNIEYSFNIHESTRQQPSSFRSIVNKFYQQA